MTQARHTLRLGSLFVLLGLFIQTVACQQTRTLQGPVAKPGVSGKDDKDKDKSKEQDDPEKERITPPNNIVGSYLVCQEQEQLNKVDQNATIQCGVYMEPTHIVTPVTQLAQWQLTGITSALRSVATTSANIVEMAIQGNDLTALRTSVKKAKLKVQTDGGGLFEGYVADLLPPDSRLSNVNASKAGALVPFWNEGFEGTRINAPSMLVHDPKTFVQSTSFNWTTPGTQTSACGTPLFEVMQQATQNGAVDNLGAAEGTQFIDTDSTCWPNNSNTHFAGFSNLTIGKDLNLVAGHVYKVSFKIRQQPLPNGAPIPFQCLQLKINGKIVMDIQTLTSAWQEMSFDWVAGSGVSKVEWSDVGSSDDSIGVLLDDLRVQVQNF